MTSAYTEKLLDCSFEDIKKSLNVKSISMIEDYTDWFYVRINDFLAGNKRDEIYMNKCVDVLDQSIRLYSLPCSLTVYRGTSSAFFYANSYINDDSFTNSTFLSTTIDNEIASHFCNKYEDGILLKINLPVNYKALWVNPLSLNRGEKEILIPRDSKFKIKSIKRVKDYNKYTMITAVPK